MKSHSVCFDEGEDRTHIYDVNSPPSSYSDRAPSSNKGLDYVKEEERESRDTNPEVIEYVEAQAAKLRSILKGKYQDKLKELRDSRKRGHINTKDVGTWRIVSGKEELFKLQESEEEKAKEKEKTSTSTSKSMEDSSEELWSADNGSQCSDDSSTDGDQEIPSLKHPSVYENTVSKDEWENEMSKEEFMFMDINHIPELQEPRVRGTDFDDASSIESVYHEDEVGGGLTPFGKEINRSQFDDYMGELGVGMDYGRGNEIKFQRPYEEFKDSEDFMTDEQLLEALRTLLGKTYEMQEPKFKFEPTQEAADFNFNLLKQNGFDLDSLLNTEKTSVTSYGSEFKPTEDLELLLKYHPRWNALKQRLEEALNFPLEDLDEDLRIKDLQAAFARGNHKSAEKHHEFLADAILKEIKKGWLLALPDETHEEIPDIILNPMGVAEHVGVTAGGTFEVKERNTHDLSFPGKVSGTSVNSRIIEEQMEPCMFGYAILRIIHYILHLRKMHSDKKILLRKDDLKSAYKRCHLDAISAKRSAIRVKIRELVLLLISLRLPFGGAPGPSEFGVLSDIIADTTNDLYRCEDWDPKELRSDFVEKVPDPIYMDEDIPFAQPREMCVDFPEEDYCKADVFIDDIISMGVDVGDNVEKLKAAPSTILHAICHKSDETFLPRDDIISEMKNKEEGAPEERKIVLGWMLNTRELLIELPKHKYKAWSSEIDTLLKSSTVSEETLLRILGRLENVATILAPLGHFLNNIRHLQMQASKSKHNVRLNSRVKKDLKLAKKFLKKANEGVDMNLLSFRSPDIIHIGDASEIGMGSFASHGRAWRYLIPEHLRGRAHINILEFLTQVVSIWIDIEEGAIKKGDCVLCMGDSTTAMGWMRRSNFREEDESNMDWLVKQKIARKLADLVLESGIVLYRQWFRGKDNIVADSLSRDLYFMSSHVHILFLRHVASTQIPKNFNIKQVPNKICSFITSMLRLLPVNTRRLKEPSPSETALLHRGKLSSLVSELQAQNSSMDSHSSNETSSCQHSQQQSEKAPSLEEIKQIWWQKQSKPPCHMWFRPSEQTTGKTPDWTRMGSSASFWKSNSKHMKNSTQNPENRKRSQQQSSDTCGKSQPRKKRKTWQNS